MAGAAGPRGALWEGHVVRAGSRAGLLEWAGRQRCSALTLPTSVSAGSCRSVRFNAPAGSFLSVVGASDRKLGGLLSGNFFVHRLRSFV